MISIIFFMFVRRKLKLLMPKLTSLLRLITLMLQLLQRRKKFWMPDTSSFRWFSFYLLFYFSWLFSYSRHFTACLMQWAIRLQVGQYTSSVCEIPFCLKEYVFWGHKRSSFWLGSGHVILGNFTLPNSHTRKWNPK